MSMCIHYLPRSPTLSCTRLDDGCRGVDDIGLQCSVSPQSASRRYVVGDSHRACRVIGFRHGYLPQAFPSYQYQTHAACLYPRVSARLPQNPPVTLRQTWVGTRTGQITIAVLAIADSVERNGCTSTSHGDFADCSSTSSSPEPHIRTLLEEYRPPVRSQS